MSLHQALYWKQMSKKPWSFSPTLQPSVDVFVEETSDNKKECLLATPIAGLIPMDVHAIGKKQKLLEPLLLKSTRGTTSPHELFLVS